MYGRTQLLYFLAPVLPVLCWMEGDGLVFTRTYGEMVIFVPVSCSIFLRLRPSLPISLPTRLLCARIFKGISSVLKWIKKLNLMVHLASKPTFSNRH